MSGTAKDRENAQSAAAAAAGAAAAAASSANAKEVHDVTCTNIPRAKSNLLHPIVFFEQGTPFFEMRHKLDGDWLIRQYFGRQLELECGLGEVVQKELNRVGIPILASLRWNGDTKSYETHLNEEVERGKALAAACQERMRERQRVGANASTAHQASVLVMDPLEPTRHIEESPGNPVQLQYPLLDGSGKNPDFHNYGKFWAFMRSDEIRQKTWHLLAFVDSYELKALSSVVGRLPRNKPPEQTDEEWLLRHAFSDERVRARCELAMVLARLPMLFSKTSTAREVKFEYEGIPRGDYSIWPRHWLVALVDTKSESKERS